MKVLILAGGYGTRLYPLVKDTPKALLEIQGKSLIDHTIEKFYLVEHIDEVVVVTNDKFYGLLSAWAEYKQGCPFPIKVINDGTKTPEERLGAIGDVIFVLDRVGMDCDWLVAGSDNLYDFMITDLVSFAQSVVPSVTIGAYDIQDIKAASKYGVLALDAQNRLVSLEEKPSVPRSSLISMCLYYLPQGSLRYLKEFLAETQSADTTGGYIQWLYQKTTVCGFKCIGQWYDIGSLESYNEAQDKFVG